MSAHKSIDKFCIVIIAFTLIIAIAFCNGLALGIETTAHAIGYENRIFDNSKVHTIDIVMNDWDSFIENCANSVLDCLNGEGCTAFIGVGSYVNLFQNISKSYRDAMLALRVGKIFEKNCYTSRYDKLGLGRLIYQLPATLCQMFIDEVFPNEAYKTLDDDTVVTIESFFANNLNGSETSRELYVHRNTLVYRLDKVKKNTGLDMRSFDDAVLFKMASMVRTYLEYLETSKDNMIR